LTPSSAEAKVLVQAHAAEAGSRIAEMQAMRRTRESLARNCQGDDRPERSILDYLAGMPVSH
jgi:hypothetical protein